MNNVFPVAWRLPCDGFRGLSTSLLTRATFRSIPSSTYAAQRGLLWPHCRSYSLRCTQSTRFDRLPVSPGHSLRTNFRIPSRSLQTSAPAYATPKNYSRPINPHEDGVAFRSKNLSTAEIVAIFRTRSISTPIGNRALRVLHGRRLSGTLDLDLPIDIRRAVPQKSLDNGLEWLRSKYPVDEDAAILERIEREEQEEEARLIRRAEELGLYKPQSGHYGAELGKEGSVYGKSVVQEVREANEAKNKEKEELERKEWMEAEAREAETLKKQLKRNTELQKFEEAAVVEARPRADPNVRPALAWIQKHHVNATNNDIDTSKLNKFWRIFPAAVVTTLTIGACYYLSENYTPPPHQKRVWRDVPPAAATVLSIIGTNVVIFALWRACPPAWRILNRYFISVPMYPYSMSVVGSVFSHQQFRHLATNMVILWFIGTKLHDDIGRGDFMSIYLASGAFASLTSLAAHVMSNKLVVTSLGASGAISGIVAAWCILHSNEKFTIWLLPSSWQETFSASGQAFLLGIIAIDVLSIVLPFKFAAMDHWAHLGGYAAGAFSGWFWKEREKQRVRERRKEENGIWGSWFGGEK